MRRNRNVRKARVGPFARSTLRLGEGLQLEVANQIVGEDAQLLPGTVGRVMLRRDHVEGELALEFGEGLLLCPAPAGEGPEGWEAQRQVRRTDGVKDGTGAVLLVYRNALP